MNHDLSNTEKYIILAIVTAIPVGIGIACILIANRVFGVRMNFGTFMFLLGYGLIGLSLKGAIDVFNDIRSGKE